jgi:hypothetical protein
MKSVYSLLCINVGLVSGFQLTSFLRSPALHHCVDLDDAFAMPVKNTRRQFLAFVTAVATFPVLSQSADASSETVFKRQTDRFSYLFEPPTDWAPQNKPLKTHLDEVNFKSPSISKYEYGITVDPVRIKSLREFGTPAEVAAKVVLSELNRDGVFDVTLAEDAFAADNDAYYQLNYTSKGKRGEKRFITKFYVRDQMLFALTAQCLDSDYGKLRNEITKTVDSFRIE